MRQRRGAAEHAMPYFALPDANILIILETAKRLFVILYLLYKLTSRQVDKLTRNELTSRRERS